MNRPNMGDSVASMSQPGGDGVEAVHGRPPFRIDLDPSPLDPLDGLWRLYPVTPAGWAGACAKPSWASIPS